MSVQEIEQALQRALARRKRLAAAREAIAALTDDERDELLVELVERTRSSNASPPPSAPTPAEPPPAIGATVQSGGPTTETKVDVIGTGVSVVYKMDFALPSKISVGDAILDVMVDGQPRVTGEIVEAVKARHPSINPKSVPSAVARLVEEGRLVVQGKGKRAAPLYVIAAGIGPGIRAEAEAKAKILSEAPIRVLPESSKTPVRVLAETPIKGLPDFGEDDWGNA